MVNQQIMQKLENAGEISKEEFLQLYEKDPDNLFNKKVGAREKINGKRYPKFINAIVNVLVEGKAPIILISGEEGSGKSMTALRIAEILHKEIGVCAGEWTSDNLVYSVEDMALRILDAWRVALIFDEAGENVSNETWASVFNRAVRGIIRTQRVRNCCYIFIIPKAKEFDSWIRERVKVVLGVSGGKKTKPTVKPIMINYDFLSIDGGKEAQQRYYMSKWNPKMPSPDLVKAYREPEADFKMQYPLQLARRVIDKKLDKEGGAAYGF